MKITLNNWKINPSPYAGLSTAVNCDTRAVSGEIKPFTRLQTSTYFKDSTEINNFIVLASAQDENGNTFAVTDTADVIQYIGGSSFYLFNIQSGLNNWSYTLSQDSVVFLDYVENGWFQFTFYPGGAGSRALNFNSSGLSGSWFFGADVIVHATFKSQIDNILYFGGYDTVLGKNVLGSLEAQPNFDPTNSGTFNINYNALDFEDGQKKPQVSAINEYGEFLVIARGDRLYTWDRNELFFENQITVSGGIIKILAKLNNNLYAITDGDGRVYQTNGSSVVYVTNIYQYLREIETIDDGAGTGANLSFATENVLSVKSNDYFTDNDKIYLSVNMKSPYSIGSYIYPYGVFSVSVSGEVNYENTGGNNMYVAEYDNIPGERAYPQIGHIFKTDSFDFTSGASIGQGFVISSYKYTGGSSPTVIDKNTSFTSTPYPTLGYFSMFETPVYVIGSPKSPATPQHLEFILGKNLQSGDGIKIYYRTDASSAYTFFKEFSYDDYGALSSLYTELAPTGDKLQLKIEMKGLVRIREIIIS